MSLLFNVLSRLIIPFLPRSMCLLISWLQSPSTVILKPKKIKSVQCFHFFSPFICHEVMGLDAMILVFWMLSFKPAFSLPFFTFIKRLSIKKAECQRIDAFVLWCWRRLLRVPWTARRSNQSILKDSALNIHWKDWCWSWNSNTLASWLIGKDPDAGKDWRQEKGTTEDEMVGWHHWLEDMSLSNPWELVMDREA